MLSRLITLLFPARCIGCDHPKTGLCRTCIASIPLSPSITDQDIIGVYHYDNPLVRRAIKLLKYKRRKEAAEALTHAAIEHVVSYLDERAISHLSSESICIVPIPIHRARARDRGFNQASLIASWIAQGLGVPVAPLLHKERPTISQTVARSKHARIKNIHDSMRAEPCDNKTLYIVVDDVATTTATFAEARRALRSAGARRILCIALAHG